LPFRKQPHFSDVPKERNAVDYNGFMFSRLLQEQCKNVEKLQIPVFLGAEMHKTQNSANTSVFEGKKMFLAG